MSSSLFDRNGVRKYLTARERLAFVYAAGRAGAAVEAFCLTLAFTGARISEVLALTASRLDVADEAVIFDTQAAQEMCIPRRSAAWKPVSAAYKLFSREERASVVLGTDDGLETG
jgi:integrase